MNLFDLEFDPPVPVLRGRHICFAYPATLRGRRLHFDFERVLGVSGTARAARVVTALYERLSHNPRE